MFLRTFLFHAFAIICQSPDNFMLFFVAASQTQSFLPDYVLDCFLRYFQELYQTAWYRFFHNKAAQGYRSPIQIFWPRFPGTFAQKNCLVYSQTSVFCV